MNRTNRNEESSLVGNAAPMSANTRYAWRQLALACHKGPLSRLAPAYQAPRLVKNGGDLIKIVADFCLKM